MKILLINHYFSCMKDKRNNTDMHGSASPQARGMHTLPGTCTPTFSIIVCYISQLTRTVSLIMHHWLWQLWDLKEVSIDLPCRARLTVRKSP